MGFGFLLPSTSKALGHKELSPQMAPGYKAAPDWDPAPAHTRAFSPHEGTWSAQHPDIHLPFAHPSQSSPRPTPRGPSELNQGPWGAGREI